MRLAVLTLSCAVLLASATACDEEGPASEHPQHSTGGAWLSPSGGSASGGQAASVEGSGGVAMAGGPALEEDMDPLGPAPFSCDALAPEPNPWLEPNTDLSRRPIFKPTGGQCGPGVEVDVWGGYFNEIFVDCRDWPFPWPGVGLKPAPHGFAVRSLVLKEPLTPGGPLALSTEVVSPTPSRVELWGSCAACGGPLELLGAQDIEAVPDGVGVCFDIIATAPHSHLLLLMSDLNAAHEHIRFCAGQTCPVEPVP